MRSAKVRPDFSVELPKELVGRLRPGESLDVIVTGERVTYARKKRKRTPTLSQVIERIRSNPPATRLTDGEIEDIVAQVRREQC